MRFEDKVIRGKSILSGETDKEKNQYNVVHILVGLVAMILLPVLIFFLSGRNPVVLYISQYIAAAAVGLLVGFWAGCVPVITNLVIISASTGRMLYKLLSGQLGSFGSREFNVRVAAWVVLVLVLFAFSYAGSKARDLWRKKRSGLGEG